MKKYDSELAMGTDAESQPRRATQVETNTLENEKRRERFLNTLNAVCERYPALEDKIRRSLDTPQLGEHHNEGATMDAHLTLILATLDQMRQGKFHDSITDEKLMSEMTQVAFQFDAENPGKIVANEALEDYTFLHDLSKPDCLTLKVEGERSGVEVTWDEWQTIAAQGTPYRVNGKLVSSISYFHGSEGSAGQHGNKATEVLKGNNLPPEILIAISKHEVAYQFSKVNAATYEEHFVKPGFTDGQQRFILVASYIDTMASLGTDGKPDLGNFMNLIKSRNNFLLIQRYVDQGIPFRSNDLAALKKQDRELTKADIERIIPSKETYDETRLSLHLDVLVAEGHLTEAEKLDVLNTAVSAPEELGKRFGPKMRFIKPCLEKAKSK